MYVYHITHGTENNKKIFLFVLISFIGKQIVCQKQLLNASLFFFFSSVKRKEEKY